ncbi:MAG: OmpA family protein, partial [Bacteroidota bacterium]
EPLLSEIKVIDAQNKRKVSNAQVRLYELNASIAGDTPKQGPIAISNAIDEDLLQLIGTEVQVVHGAKGEIFCPIQSGKNYLVKVENEAHFPVQHLLTAPKQAEAYTIALENSLPYFDLGVNPLEDAPTSLVQETKKIKPKIFVPLIAATAVLPKSTMEKPIEQERPAISSNDLENETARKKEVIRLNNIYYGFNQHQLNDGSKAALADLLELLSNYPNMTIRISSHTDTRGKANYNLQLSQRRADAVRNYLVEQGIAQKRIQAVGYGESQPINECNGQEDCLEKEHEENRRTEFEVIYE